MMLEEAAISRNSYLSTHELSRHLELQKILPLAAICWAACGKDPGFTPLSLLQP
jgi:hypothetical protein